MSKGLEKAKEIYQNRSKRASELKGEGKKIIGYYCCFPPLELMTALDLVPYRILGSAREPLSRVDTYLETIMCPYIRSCFDQALKGNYDLLDGVVMPHACDNTEKTYEIWKHNFKPAYAHLINVPHMTNATSTEFFKKEIERFQKSLEDLAGKKISSKSLTDAIKLHNENRTLLREIYQLRKPNPPRISGVEVIQLMVAGMSIPAKEYNDLLKEVIAEVQARPDQSPSTEKRIMIFGSIIDDIAFIELVEGCGAKVVVEDLCTTTRVFWHDVPMGNDPLEDLTERYLKKTYCPRTYRRRVGTRQEDLEDRYGHLREFAHEFGVDGVIMYIIRFCDTHEFDVPDVKEYLTGLGLPVLHIEDDYKVSNVGQLKTRIEAFLEILS